MYAFALPARSKSLVHFYPIVSLGNQVMKHQSETDANGALEAQHKTEFLNLLGKDIVKNCQNLVIVTPVLKQEMDEIVGDYEIDLNGEF